MAPTNFQVRAKIELHDRSLPVLYSAFRQYVAQGTAILRPLVLVAHHDADAYWRSSEFFLGDHLLIIPITREGSEGRFLYLPEGDWFSYHDDCPPKAVKKDIWVDCGLGRIPVYVKAGAVLAHWPLQQYVGEIPNPEPELHVWWKNGHEQSFWYEDAGDGESWRDGVYRESTIEVIGTAETLEINRSRVGT